MYIRIHTRTHTHRHSEAHRTSFVIAIAGVLCAGANVFSAIAFGRKRNNTLCRLSLASADRVLYVVILRQLSVCSMCIVEMWGERVARRYGSVTLFLFKHIIGPFKRAQSRPVFDSELYPTTVVENLHVFS